MDSILQVVLEQLKELKKDIRTNQEKVKREMSISQDKLVNCQELKKDTSSGQEDLKTK
jgi:hypothetical protein